MSRDQRGSFFPNGDLAEPPDPFARATFPATPSTATIVRVCRRTEQPRARAEQPKAPAVVVAAALVRDGRVLAQQRAYPPELAGRWELPGGRVEPEESAREALIRECREELAVEVMPGEQLGQDVPLPSGYVLRVHVARLAQPRATPVLVEHEALRWVDVSELAELDWLDADRAILPDLEVLLRAQRRGAAGFSGVPE